MRATTAILLLALPFLTGCGGPAKESGPEASARELARDPGRPLPSPLPDIAARVNGEDIPFFRILPLARAELEAIPESEQEARMPEAVRRALDRYIDRELLFQEATRRGMTADQRALDWAYDQARAAVPDDEAWGRFLAEQGMDEKAFRAELRVQHTVAALLEAEAQVAEEPAEGVPPAPGAEIRRVLLARLRAEARIETYL